MKKPNAIAEVAVDIAKLGMILGTLYGALVAIGFKILSPEFDFALLLLFIFTGAWVGLSVGSTFGIGIGVAVGGLLEIALNTQQFPLLPTARRHIRAIGHVACFLACLGAFGFVLYAEPSQFRLGIWSVTLVVIPLCISFFASIYAVNRYLKKLDMFMSGKSKVKREASA